MTKDAKPLGFTRGKKTFETIKWEDWEIEIEKKGSLTPAEKIDLETFLKKSESDIIKPFDPTALFSLAEAIATQTKRPVTEVYNGLATSDRDFYASLDFDSAKEVNNKTNTTIEQRRKSAETETSIYACVILRSRHESFSAIVPENLLDPNHELFLPYPFLEGIAEFCYRELYHHKEKKFLDQDDLKSLS